MSADPLVDDHEDDDEDPHGTPLGSFEIVATDSTGGSGTAAAGPAPLSDVPALSSNPGAAATIYLDFNGHFEATWGSYSNITTPAYDQDGDPTTFSEAELASIQQIWAGVAEDYAPFNVNVTTVEPPSFANGVALRVVIGGNGSWSGGTYGGLSYVNSFTSSVVNTAFVFSKNLSNGYAKYTTDAASHEAGHALGLRHQSTYDGSGTLTQTYSTGPGNGTAPLMGNSYSASRSLWWQGTTTSAMTVQDDMSVLAASTNGFGYRLDDHGNSTVGATSLLVSGSQLDGFGIITTTADLDYFSFGTAAGQISLTVDVAQFNNLDVRLELRSATGVVIATAAPSTSFGAAITATVSAGDYWLVVASSGGYGNVGQYWVSGSVVVSATSISGPSNLQASVTAGGIALAWSDNASNESGYRVERSTDGVTWSVIADGLNANTTSFVDGNVVPGGSYVYRVQAYNLDSAAYSNSASASVAPSAPDVLLLSVVSSSRIDLTWSNVSGETGYRIERSTDGVNWVQIGTTTADVTTWSSTGLNAETTYLYRVKAVNAGGVSAAGPTSSATTLEAPAAPVAPSGLTAVAVSSKQVQLSWNDNSSSESGFWIERSSDGGRTFTVVGNVGANTATFVDGTVAAKKQYVYRVQAVSTVNSAYSNVASVTTPANGKAFPSLAKAALPSSGEDSPTRALAGIAETVRQIRASVADEFENWTPPRSVRELREHLVEVTAEARDRLFAILGSGLSSDSL